MYKSRSLDSSSGVMGENSSVLEIGPIVKKPASVERKIGLGLIDSRQLMRCSISDLLVSYAPEFSVLPYASCSELLESPDEEKERLGLLLMDVNGASVSSAGVQGNIDVLHQVFSSIPLILLSDRMDVDCTVEVLCRKISGYVTTDLAPPVAIAAIRLVYAGGKYFPAEKFSNVSSSTLQKKPTGQAGYVKLGIDALTSRQHEVFRQLKEGKSNKLIAYELGVQESTVKVHVRDIMKKLHATNRTHAVFLASKLSKLGLSD